MQGGDVLAYPISIAKLLMGDRPVHEVRNAISNLLGNKSFDDHPIDETQVHQNVAQAPVREL